MTTLQRGAFTIILGAGLAAGGFAAYKWAQARSRRSASKPAVLATPGLVSSVPPFSTKEPDRYQATRVISSVENDGDGDQASPSVTKILIARDGDQRREDYDTDADFRTSYLEIQAGTFVLLPSRKLYAETKAESPSVPMLDGNSGVDFSAERLLNEPPAARYEKLGSEKLDGRATTKYRVSSIVATNGTDAATVTLIWIDDALGMPIRSETAGADGNQHSKLTVELREIQLQVDPKLFELPKDYRRVEDLELRDLQKQIRVAASSKAAKL